MLVGGRELCLSSNQCNPQQNHCKIHLIPYLNSKNDIVGTQLIIMSENTKRQRQVLVFENAVERRSSMPSSVLIDYQGYKLYRSETDGSMMAVMAYVVLGNCVYWQNVADETSLGLMERSEVIRGALRTIMNTVIYDPI